jgi:hypothetical protein
MNARPLFLQAILVLAMSCARSPAPPPNETASTPQVAPVATAAASVRAGPAPVDSQSVPETSASSASSGPVARSAPAPEPSPEPLPGSTDFIAQARTLFRVAACGPTGDVPPRFDAVVVASHCDELARAYADYRRAWVDVARPFIASLRPADLPRVAVYPFGGGDLTSALTTFPDAIETTTISLEPAGDVRPVDTLPADRLAHELWVHRSHLERLFEKAHSRTDNLEKESRTDLPGELVFALAALVVHEREPVGLRYFRLRPDGSIAYVTQGDIDAARTVDERRSLFANAELRFRRTGAADAPVQVLRHISFNLDDAHLQSDKTLLAHLNSKRDGRRDGEAKVATMTKAASHLLWSDHFSIIRGWLLAHTDWMISDSTGIPPRFANPAGFVQDVYGTFAGPAAFGLVDALDAADFKKLFDAEPPSRRELPFRYGYPDRDGHAHLVVTRRSARSAVGVDGGSAGSSAAAGLMAARGAAGPGPAPGETPTDAGPSGD